MQLVKFALYSEITTRVIAAETAVGGEHVSLAAEARVIKFEFRQTAPSAFSLCGGTFWALLSKIFPAPISRFACLRADVACSRLQPHTLYIISNSCETRRFKTLAHSAVGKKRRAGGWKRKIGLFEHACERASETEWGRNVGEHKHLNLLANHTRPERCQEIKHQPFSLNDWQYLADEKKEREREGSAGEPPKRKVKFLPVPSGVITQPPGAAAKNLPRCSARKIIYLDAAVAECYSGVYFAPCARPGVYVCVL